jgi:hypothetical protein
MPEENVEVVRSMLGAFNCDDVDAVIAAFAEGCEIREPLEMPGSPAMGYSGARQHPRMDAKSARRRPGRFRAAALHVEW